MRATDCHRIAPGLYRVTFTDGSSVLVTDVDRHDESIG